MIFISITQLYLCSGEGEENPGESAESEKRRDMYGLSVRLMYSCSS
jgi:hypothetical protein